MYLVRNGCARVPHRHNFALMNIIFFPWRGEHSPEAISHENIFTTIFLIWKMKLSSSVTGRARVRARARVPHGHNLDPIKNLFIFSWRGEHSPEAIIFEKILIALLFELYPCEYEKAIYLVVFLIFGNLCTVV